MLFESGRRSRPAGCVLFCFIIMNICLSLSHLYLLVIKQRASPVSGLPPQDKEGLMEFGLVKKERSLSSFANFFILCFP